MKSRNFFGFIIISIIIAAAFIPTACNNFKRYNVLYTRYIGTTKIKGEGTFVAETRSKAIDVVNYTCWQNCDSIKINYIYEVSR
jgi:hypothetical protein